MQKHWRYSVTILVILFSVLLWEEVKGGVNAAPQGRELYAKIEQEEAKGANKVESTNEESHHVIAKKELIVEENQEELSSRPNQAAKKESLPITRKSATHDEIPQHKSHDAEQSGNIGSNDPVVLGFHEEEDHKLAARQIEDETSDVNRDEFVAILQRQRDDLIAASRVAESPLPVENMRVNMNSGL